MYYFLKKLDKKTPSNLEQAGGLGGRTIPYSIVHLGTLLISTEKA